MGASGAMSTPLSIKMFEVEWWFALLLFGWCCVLLLFAVFLCSLVDVVLVAPRGCCFPSLLFLRWWIVLLSLPAAATRMDKGTKVELQDCFDSWVPSCDEAVVAVEQESLAG